MVQGAADFTPARDNGRFELSEQQNQAVRLLLAAQAGDRRARLRLAGARGGAAPDLRDARNAVARDVGFQDWNRFERYARELDGVRSQGRQPLDQDMQTLHIRCGADIQAALVSAGFTGHLQAFTDPFCVGPVRHNTRARLVSERAQFLTQAFGLDQRQTLERHRREYQALEDAVHYTRVVLWFEPNSYDQLILAYLLHRIGQWHRRPRVELVAVDTVPGVKRFVGLGQLAPEVLGWLWSQRQPVDRRLLALGQRAWRALTASTPRRLAHLSQHLTPALPMLSRALRRHLLELPDEATGLGLSEQLAVQLVAERGPIRAGQVFTTLVREREPLPYLTDALFWWLLRPLLHGHKPLLARRRADQRQPWVDQELTITSHGHAVLSGHRNWLDSHPPRRWVGGIAVDGDRDSWCLNKAAGRPIPRLANGIR